MVSEERLLKGKIGPKSTDVTGIWKILHKEKLYGYQFSPYSNMMILFNHSKIIWVCGYSGEKIRN
jgi:hypothetical protein